MRTLTSFVGPARCSAMYFLPCQNANRFTIVTLITMMLLLFEIISLNFVCQHIMADCADATPNDKNNCSYRLSVKWRRK